MKREKGRKLIKFCKKKLFNRLTISLFLSFSLHILIILLIAISIIKVQNFNDLKKNELKPVQIVLSDTNKSNIGLDKNQNKEAKTYIKDTKNKDTQNITNETNKDLNKTEEKSDIDLKRENANKNEVNTTSSINDITTSSLENTDSNNINEENSQNNAIEKKINEESTSSFYDNFIKKIFSFSLNASSLFTYPKDALKMRIEGTVSLKIAIDEKGKVVQVILEQSSGHRILDDYTVKQASKLLFNLPQNIDIKFPLWISIKIVYTIKSNVSLISG